MKSISDQYRGIVEVYSVQLIGVVEMAGANAKQVRFTDDDPEKKRVIFEPSKIDPCLEAAAFHRSVHLGGYFLQGSEPSNRIYELENLLRISISQWPEIDVEWLYDHPELEFLFLDVEQRECIDFARINPELELLVFDIQNGDKGLSQLRQLKHLGLNCLTEDIVTKGDFTLPTKCDGELSVHYSTTKDLRWLHGLNGVMSLSIDDCPNLESLDGIEALASSLERLVICNCRKLDVHSAVSNLPKLKVAIHDGKSILSNVDRMQQEVKVNSMSEDLFWSVLQSTRRKKKRFAQLPELMHHWSIDEVISFQNLLNAKIAALDSPGMRTAAYLVSGSLSEDGYESFCCHIVSFGRSRWEKAVKNPDSMGGWLKKEVWATCDNDDLLLSVDKYCDQIDEETAGEILASEAPFSRPHATPISMVAENIQKELPKLSREWPIP